MAFRDFRGRRFVAIIGSREPAEGVVEILEDVGEVLCDSNIAITSGDADGCDSAGLRGAMRSQYFGLTGARIYLPWNGVRRSDGTRRYHDGEVFFDASRFENYEVAQGLALLARGTFEGLGRGGIALHSRNPYQVLLDDLNTPVGSVICWAKPVGKKGAVKGGTNTAVQIAIQRKIPIINLATDEGMEKILQYLRKKGKRT